MLSSLSFFNLRPASAIYTLSLHDALPISLFTVHQRGVQPAAPPRSAWQPEFRRHIRLRGSEMRYPTALVAAHSSQDRKSTRLNSSHRTISYAVFCLNKKKATPVLLLRQNA